MMYVMMVWRLAQTKRQEAGLQLKRLRFSLVVTRMDRRRNVHITGTVQV